MRVIHLLLTMAIISVPSLSVRAASAKVVKVLPHLLDRQGRHTLSPSLYERDAYQAYLRQHPEERSGLRFDVQWKSATLSRLTLRIELRGSRGKEPTTALIQSAAKHTGIFSQWSAATLSGEDYQKFGELVAWRVTLWDGNDLVAEQKSFLW
jgi:hypothetical protein